MDELNNNISEECFFEKLDIEFLIHEMKDPLAVIETGIRTLLEKQKKFGSLNERQIKTLKRVLRNTHKARGMIYGLLEVGRSEAGGFVLCKFAPCEATFEALVEAHEAMLGEVPEAMAKYEQFHPSKGFFFDNRIYIDFSDEASACHLYHDRMKFGQIVGNLIKNALHHRRKRIDILMKCEANNLIVEVADDGPGIDPAHHKGVFQRYQQLAPSNAIARKGHGLGLAGARTIARVMGGDIYLTSQRDNGAIFRLELPIKVKSKTGYLR